MSETEEVLAADIEPEETVDNDQKIQNFEQTVEEKPLDDSKLRQFEAEHAKILEERRQEAAKKKEQTEAIAKTEIEDFYSQRETLIKKNLAINRDEEKSIMANIDGGKEIGNTWERVAKYSGDLRPKPEGEKPDTSRMRGVLLQLKSDPIKKD